MAAPIFVYGTLKLGGVNHERGLAGMPFLGLAITERPYPLVVAGRWFSPVLLDEPGRGRRVTGELYAASAADLARLDRLEGTHLAGGYRRRRIAVIGPAGRLLAWSWLKDRAAAGPLHGPPLAAYAGESRYVAPEGRHRRRR